MAQYTVTAKLLNTYEIKIEANSASDALDEVDKWNAEDFEDYLINQQWDIEAH